MIFFGTLGQVVLGAKNVRLASRAAVVSAGEKAQKRGACGCFFPDEDFHILSFEVILSCVKYNNNLFFLLHPQKTDLCAKSRPICLVGELVEPWSGGSD